MAVLNSGVWLFWVVLNCHEGTRVYPWVRCIGWSRCSHLHLLLQLHLGSWMMFEVNFSDSLMFMAPKKEYNPLREGGHIMKIS